MGIEAAGIHEFVFHAIMRCEIDTRKMLCAHILLAGGNTCFEGMEERLHTELDALSPPTFRFGVHAAPERRISVWIGGSIIASLANYRSMWVTKAQYEEGGASVMHAHALG